MPLRRLLTRHTSSRMCVGCVQSPESLTYVSSSGFSRLPPSCNSNYFGLYFIPVQSPLSQRYETKSGEKSPL
ncbi:hypothetical protein EFV61_15685 [Yersinia enterocolitica]|nr:hypothetical protein [Yersinia enterocolitica]EKN4927951.1 hypothetical protein [Yersinia enterocolitica]EKN4931876.1 hypothetical protein [Yersinia enterocolitica]EKN5014305.1 hypothetical protein [Yersinia enterocolitica]EKN5026714.1 hypothetical protein [Yersinia enterocolitica]